MVQKRTAYSSQRSDSSYWRQYQGQIVTYTTMGLCGIVFAYQNWAREQAKRHNNMKPLRFVTENLILNLSNVRAGRWWTLITHSFMHFSPLHLSFNALGILSFGPTIVTFFGPSGFVVGWVGSALAGGVASLWWENYVRKSGRNISGSVGASGSLFGFLTMLACLKPSHPVGFFLIPITFPIWGLIAGTTALSLTFMASSILPFIGHAGHLGGICFGGMYYALRLRGKRIRRF